MCLPPVWDTAETRPNHTTRHSLTPSIATYSPTQETAPHGGAYAQTRLPTPTRETAAPSITTPGPGSTRVWPRTGPGTARCSDIQTASFTTPGEPPHTKVQPPGDTGSGRWLSLQTQIQVHVPRPAANTQEHWVHGKGSTHIEVPCARGLGHGHTGHICPARNTEAKGGMNCPSLRGAHTPWPGCQGPPWPRAPGKASSCHLLPHDLSSCQPGWTGSRDPRSQATFHHGRPVGSALPLSGPSSSTAACQMPGVLGLLGEVSQPQVPQSELNW